METIEEKKPAAKRSKTKGRRKKRRTTTGKKKQKKTEKREGSTETATEFVPNEQVRTMVTYSEPENLAEVVGHLECVQDWMDDHYKKDEYGERPSWAPTTVYISCSSSGHSGRRTIDSLEQAREYIEALSDFVGDSDRWKDKVDDDTADPKKGDSADED